MKILHINTYTHGGAAIGAIRIHKSLLSSGVDSSILFYKHSSDNLPNASATSVKYPNLKQRLLKKLGINATLFEKETQKINQMGKSFYHGGTFELFSSPYGPEENLHNHPLVKDADIINLHWVNGFVNLPSFIKNINKPIVWTLHDMNPYLGGFHYDIDLTNNPSFLELENQYKHLKKETLKNKKYSVIGNSNWNTKCAIDSKQFENANSIETIYYPLNPADFNAIEKNSAKISLGLPSDKTIIGFACEDLTNPRKGFRILLDALSSLKIAEREKIYCLSFGKENNGITDLEGLDIMQLGTINNSKIQSIIYSAMDFFVMPSTAEAFGLTCLEAMACETAVIGANVGGIPEMVEDGKTGFLFEKSNQDSLKNAILKALETTDSTRKQMNFNAKKNALSRHNPKLIAGNYKELYTNLLND